MNHILIHFRDYLDLTPIGNFAVNLICTVVPYFKLTSEEVQSLADDTPDLYRRKLLVSSLSSSTGSPDFSRSSERTFSRVVDSTGILENTLDLDDLVDAASITEHHNGSLPVKVFVFVDIAIDANKEVEKVHFFSRRNKTTIKLEGKFSSGRILVLFDRGKSIVGDTTSTSVKLWFQLHCDEFPPPRTRKGFYCYLQSHDKTYRSVKPLNFTGNIDQQVFIDQLEFTDLHPGIGYEYQVFYMGLLSPDAEDHFDPADPRYTRLESFIRGHFSTPAIGSHNLSFVFGCCHDPVFRDSLERWGKLASNEKYEFIILLGDQIYADGLGSLPDASWFMKYVLQYDSYWKHQPVREVMRRTPTYMMQDDHEYFDDFGTSDPDRDRQEAARRAYYTFQHQHNPGGEDYSNPAYFSFKKSMASFFVADLRTSRVENPTGSHIDHPVLGNDQFQDIVKWATSAATQSSDVVYFISPVPFSFVPVDFLDKVLKQFIDKYYPLLVAIYASKVAYDKIYEALDNEGFLSHFAIKYPLAIEAAILGFVYGGAIGLVQDIFGFESTDAILAAEDKLYKKLDIKEAWEFRDNQRDLSNVLQLLFELSNGLDISAAGSNAGKVPKKRAVFVIGGDIHLGTCHKISAPAYQHLPIDTIYQFCSSGISRHPGVTLDIISVMMYDLINGNNPNSIPNQLMIFQTALTEITGTEKFARIFEIIKQRVLVPQSEYHGSTDMVGTIIIPERNKITRADILKIAEVFADYRIVESPAYRCRVEDMLFERNYGLADVEKVEETGRTYRFYFNVDGASEFIRRIYQVNLDLPKPIYEDITGSKFVQAGKIATAEVFDGFEQVDGKDLFHSAIRAEFANKNLTAGFNPSAGETNVRVHRCSYLLLISAFDKQIFSEINYSLLGISRGNIISTTLKK
jgi:hypothetical protein